ncbi:MAG: tetratricopeptide repeat protein, partial [Candidatus Cloacimonetes bacterium]|nr:tetratricopeptide repeat protein [Candidatus Cloacimonadota bacterium]
MKKLCLIIVLVVLAHVMLEAVPATKPDSLKNNRKATAFIRKEIQTQLETELKKQEEKTDIAIEKALDSRLNILIDKQGNVDLGELAKDLYKVEIEKEALKQAQITLDRSRDVFGKSIDHFSNAVTLIVALFTIVAAILIGTGYFNRKELRKIRDEYVTGLKRISVEAGKHADETKKIRDSIAGREPDKLEKDEKEDLESASQEINQKANTGQKLTANDYFIRAMNFHSTGKYSLAIDEYSKCLELSPDDKYALNNKGIALINLKKYDEAIVAFDKAIEIDPGNASAWYNKGNTRSDLKKYDEAIVAYDKAIEIDPENAFAWNNKGNALNNLKKYDE